MIFVIPYVFKTKMSVIRDNKEYYFKILKSMSLRKQYYIILYMYTIIYLKKQ